MTIHQHALKSLRIAVLAAAALPLVGSFTGCAVARKQESVGAYVDDTTITTKVKAQFAADKSVSALAISVETLNGVVQLSGFAKTAQEKASAEEIARGVGGVKGVRNDIIIRAN